MCAMRDLANKMAELSFEAPLAKFEETDEWGDTIPNYQPADQDSPNANLKAALTDTLNLNLKDQTDNNILMFADEPAVADNDNGGDSPNCNSSAAAAAAAAANAKLMKNALRDTHVDNFAEAFTGSLEDLVNTFDEKLTKCFGNYEQSVEELAPVQVRTQEEVMNDCQ